MVKLFKGIFVISCCLLLSGCFAKDKFVGSSTSDGHEYHLTYKVLNDERDNSLDLSQGDELKVEIDNQSGKIQITIENDLGEKLLEETYSKTKENFSIDIPQSGSYKISVMGENAKGELRFVKQK